MTEPVNWCTRCRWYKNSCPGHGRVAAEKQFCDKEFLLSWEAARAPFLRLRQELEEKKRAAEAAEAINQGGI